MQTQRARSGPRTDVDARELIIATAERLFGDLSIEGVSLRAVAREAGVGSRAVTYHFPEKRDLLAAVVRRRSRILGPAIAQGLQALALDRDAKPLRCVVEAVVSPFVAMFAQDPRGGLRWMKVFAVLALTEDEIWAAELEQGSNLIDDFVSATRNTLPDLSSDVGRIRGRFAMFNVISALAHVDRAAYGAPLGPEGLDPMWVEQLVAYTTAGLRSS